MPTYIALLRGINVSGQKKIKMAELRNLLTEAGLTQVQTYLQSGNVVFQSESSEKASEKIERCIMEHYGYQVKVLLTTPDALGQIVAENPFSEQDTKLLYVTFLAEDPAPELLEKLQAVDYSPETFVFKDNIIYTFAANGYGRAKLNNNFLEKKLKVAATTRNWKTVNALLEMSLKAD
jgi:uncharacterized protein (DUF1697 family)